MARKTACSKHEIKDLSDVQAELIKGFGAQITDYPTYISRSDLLCAQMTVGVEKALIDIMSRQEEGGIEDARRCADRLVYEEFFAPK